MPSGLTQIRKRRVTVTDVAKHAGVSVGLTSMVLNRRASQSSDTTKAKVAAAARDLGYRPNIMARMLRAKQTRTLGLAIPDLTLPYHALLAASLAQATQDAEFHPLIELSSPTGPRISIQNLQDRLVDGLLLVLSTKDRERRLKLAGDMPPIVAVDASADAVTGGTVDRIIVDRGQGVYEATRHLLERGRRRVVIVLRLPLSPVGLPKSRGWRRAYEEAGLTVPKDDWIVQLPERCDCPEPMTLGKLLVDRALGQVPSLDGILLCPDEPTPAIGAMIRLTELGRRVPEDVAVVGMHGKHDAEGLPELATVAFPVEQMTGVAVRMLLERIQATVAVPPSRTLELSTRFIPGRSSG